MTNRYRTNPRVGPSDLLLWAVSQRRAHGKTCKEIATELGIAPRTVHAWIKRKHDADELLGQ